MKGFQLNRRKFINTASASLALTAMGVSSFGLNRPPKTLRVGLIGTGWYGKSDLFRLMQVASVEVISICDVDENVLSRAAELVSQRQKSGKTPETYTDYRELLAKKDLDIVIIGPQITGMHYK